MQENGTTQVLYPMLRISKLTDYGVLLLAHLAGAPERTAKSARDLAKATGIPLPTVGKILKALSRGEILNSERGVHGGYHLSRAPHLITMAEVIRLLEGGVALTECNQSTIHRCSLEFACPVRGPWSQINQRVYQTLNTMTLSDMQVDIK